MPEFSFKIKKPRIQTDFAVLSRITSPPKHLKAWRAWRENGGYLTFVETCSFFPDLFIYFGKQYTEKKGNCIEINHVELISAGEAMR